MSETATPRQASEHAVAAASVGHGGVTGADRDGTDGVNQRLQAFVDKINEREPRKVAQDDGPMVNRTYRLPDDGDMPEGATIEDYRRRLRELAARTSAPGDELPGHWTCGAELARDDPDEGSNGEITSATGLIAPPRLTAAIRRITGREDNGQAMTVLPDDGWTGSPTPHKTGMEPHDPVRLVDLTDGRGDNHLAVCLLCPEGPERVSANGATPSEARTKLSGHMRQQHGRSPWPGAQ